MYKVLASSHLDYCDLIYHIPPTLTQRGLSLHNLMEKVERIQYQAALAIKMKNLVGKLYLIVD